MGHRLRHVGLGRCGAGAQQLWGAGLIAWRHGGPSWSRDGPVSSALAGGFLTAAPPGEPFSPSCKDMALDLRSTLIQCDLTLIHFVSKDTVSKQGPTMDFWVDLNFVVTLFIQRIWKLKSNPHPKCEVPTPFPTENISEGTWICFV